jgi:hypothetical protein
MVSKSGQITKVDFPLHEKVDTMYNMRIILEKGNNISTAYQQIFDVHMRDLQQVNN